MQRFGRGAVLGISLTIAAALGLVPALAPAPALAATPKLTIVGATTYDVRPDEGRVAVSVRLTATNHQKNTITRRFFYRTAFITVLPGTSGFKITGGVGNPKVSVSSTTATYTNLKLDFGANLAAGKSTTLNLTFDIRDGGGSPTRAVRISQSIVSFAAWAVASPDTPGASVAVRLPAGYGVTIGRGPLDGPTAADTGHEVWSSGSLAEPLDFVAEIAADRPTDYAETNLAVQLAGGTATVLLRAWPDDTAWRDRVGGLIARALPVFEREIGVPWPIEGPLAVHEALLRTTGGFAGLFDPAKGSIEIAYTATDGVVLHELAHAWFNGRLVADRWTAEAFASYYAALAADELDIVTTPPTLPTDPSPAAIPLNAWGPTGSESPESETWAYAASLELARQIAARVGPERLRAVWARAALGFAAYQPDAAASEPALAPPDWRGLLDLLEDEAGVDLGDLWRTWVARPEDVPLLAERATARASYVESAALAGEWRLPPTIREALRAWRFDVAQELLTAADAVLTQRDQLETSAAAAGATLPGTLRAAFEGPGGVGAAAAEATAEQSTVDAIAAAQAARPAATGIVEQAIIAIGLLPDAPEAQVAAAHAALSAGDLQASYAVAEAARTEWLGAAAVGRSRIVSVALLVVALLLAGGLLRERRRRHSAEPTEAPPG